MNEPRVYKHSPVIIVIFILMLVGFIVLLSSGIFDGGLVEIALLLLLFGLIFSVVVFSYSSKTTLSDDEISSQNIFGTRTLRWTEIHRVSGRGYNIKLHNFDEDVIVAPSPQLPHYEEIVEQIGEKRPDLFSPQEFSEMKRGVGFLAGIGVLVLAVIGFAVFFTLQIGDLFSSNFFFIVIALLVVFAFVIYKIVATVPMSVILEGHHLFLKYLVGQRTLPADEIKFIRLSYTQSRNGKIYFVEVSLVNGRALRLSGLSPNLPTAYLVLKNWHKSHALNRQTNP